MNQIISDEEIWWNPQIHAVGDIVCHLDADDAILPGTFEKIIHYFNLFPEATLLHFNANKYHNVLPQNSTNLFDNFKDNVYMSRDNNSFLEGFEKLWPQRSNIFGYLLNCLLNLLSIFCSFGIVS